MASIHNFVTEFLKQHFSKPKISMINKTFKPSLREMMIIWAVGVAPVWKKLTSFPVFTRVPHRCFRLPHPFPLSVMTRLTPCGPNYQHDCNCRLRSSYLTPPPHFNGYVNTHSLSDATRPECVHMKWSSGRNQFHFHKICGKHLCSPIQLPTA